MLHPDEIGQAIRDRQARYHHEAYRGRHGSRPVRRWMRTHLITIGESSHGAVTERMEPVIVNE